MPIYEDVGLTNAQVFRPSYNSESDDLHALKAVANHPLIVLIIVDLPVSVLAMIIECSPMGATTDIVMVRCLAVVASSIVFSTTMDIDVVNTVGGSSRHSSAAGRRDPGCVGKLVDIDDGRINQNPSNQDIHYMLVKRSFPSCGQRGFRLSFHAEFDTRFRQC